MTASTRTRTRITVAASAVIVLAVVVVAIVRSTGSGVDGTPATPGTPPPAGPTVLAVPRPGAGNPVHAGFIGDSLTFGLYATDAAHGWARTVLAGMQERYGAVQGQFDDKSGATVRQLLQRRPLPTGLNVAFVELGTNDVPHTPVPKFERQYRELLDQLHSGSPGVRVMCLGTWGPASGRNAVIDHAIATLCATASGVYVPLEALYAQSSNRGPAGRAAFGGTADDFHPNDTGYAAIARLVLSHLR
jgi:lysophospholipase L1-like esterase